MNNPNQPAPFSGTDVINLARSIHLQPPRALQEKTLQAVREAHQPLPDLSRHKSNRHGLTQQRNKPRGIDL